MRVLLAEDDTLLGEGIQTALRRALMTVDWVQDGVAALAALRQEPFDAAVMDLGLPRLDGTAVIRDARRAGVRTPILALTARDQVSDRVQGLELGADDYITKPFSPKELVARVRALLRRLERVVPTAGSLSYGPLVIDLDRHIVTVDGQETRLTAKEFLLLQYLMTHRGRVLSRDLLLSDVWDYSYTGGTRTVDVHVRRLREKLPFLVDALVTVKQFGYKLLEPAPAAIAPERSASHS